MLYTLRFFSSKCSLFHNANLFGSYIIHTLYTGCAEIKKKKIIPAPRVKVIFHVVYQVKNNGLQQFTARIRLQKLPTCF
jgi:hypothetical protein